MKKALIITEGRHDAEILRKILPPDILDQIQIVSSGGSALSLARSVLVTKRIPTVLLVDSDSNNERSIIEKRNDLNESLNSVSVGTKFKVILMVPEMEILFLENPDFIKNISGRQENFSNLELQLAKSNPKKFLSEIVHEAKPGDFYQEILAKLDAKTITAMKKHELIKDLTAFLYSVLDNSPTPALALNE